MEERINLTCDLCGFKAKGVPKGWIYIRLFNKRTYASHISATLCDHCRQEATIGAEFYFYDEETTEPRESEGTK